MVFNWWHGLLGMQKHDLAWHKQDMADEIKEYEEAKGFIARWSELSDIVYTYTRGRWSGHQELVFPLSPWQFAWGSLYMFPKYSLRWLFFVTTGKQAGAEKTIREVRNPAKLFKLDDIAERYGVDKERFREICGKLLRFWPLLK
jgi:hypothetical protein